MARLGNHKVVSHQVRGGGILEPESGITELEGGGSSQKRENPRIRRWGILESRSGGLISQSKKCRGATKTDFKEKKYQSTHLQMTPQPGLRSDGEVAGGQASMNTPRTADSTFRLVLQPLHACLHATPNHSTSRASVS